MIEWITRKLVILTTEVQRDRLALAVFQEQLAVVTALQPIGHDALDATGIQAGRLSRRSPPPAPPRTCYIA